VVQCRYVVFYNKLSWFVSELPIKDCGSEDTNCNVAYSSFFFVKVDIENPDLAKYPQFETADYKECILKAGEMLYIPRKHWHFVKSLSVSFSVSFWWS
jgi:lysine-specific demethylase 8